MPILFIYFVPHDLSRERITEFVADSKSNGYVLKRQNTFLWLCDSAPMVDKRFRDERFSKIIERGDELFFFDTRDLLDQYGLANGDAPTINKLFRD